MFEKTLTAGWGDMDFNGHMRNTAFLDKSGDVRMMYFSEKGFSMSEFMRLRLGPVVRRDEVEYYREVHLLEDLKVGLSLAGLSEDGSHFRLCNTFTKSHGQMAAKVISTGGWLNLAERKLMAPPEGLLIVLKELVMTENFVTLPSSVRQ